MKTLSGKFDISEMEAHAGVVTFSSDAKHNIKLKDHTDVASFQTAVDDISFMGSGDTRIDVGLQLVQKELYKPSNGGRVGSRKILIMLLCGDQTSSAVGAMVCIS